MAVGKIQFNTGVFSNPISTKKVGFNSDKEMFNHYGVNDKGGSPTLSAAEEYRQSMGLDISRK